MCSSGTGGRSSATAWKVKDILTRGKLNCGSIDSELQAKSCHVEDGDGIETDRRGILGLKDDGINVLNWNATAVTGYLARKEGFLATTIDSLS